MQEAHIKDFKGGIEDFIVAYIYIHISIQYALVWELFLVPILLLPVHVTFSAFRCREWTDLWLIFGPKAGDQMS